ncbi:N-6 DNA methylase [Stenotrophomonas sp.]|uniref:HsdM family class I SAM-dependent methyltransferase n=1 Tax=Stenotrophomonas sp. TaxID=69392 RepID=UPI00289AEA44|nr:N-6 DNA methylase [Stenotrophomonas sp.]
MSGVALRSSRATLSALKLARRCMEGHADEEAATHLLLMLVVLKVASDADADRHAAAAGRGASDTPAPTGARALEVCSATLFDRLARAPLDGLSARVGSVLHTFCLDNPDALDQVTDALDMTAGLPTDGAMYRVIERLRIPALDFRLRHGQHRPDLAEATDQMLGQPLQRRSREDGLHVPEALASIMMAVLDPCDGDHILDPACDRGCLLLAAARWAQRDTPTARVRLHGQDVDRRRWAMARVRLLLHGHDGACLQVADPLAPDPDATPLIAQAGVQVVLSRPPLSLKWNPERASWGNWHHFQHGIPPRQWAHMALIQHMRAQLDPHQGRMAIVVPNGVLFREGEEAKIRRSLLEANEVDTIISLPERLFKGTAMSTSLLVMRKARSDTSVLFIDSRPLLMAAGKGARLNDDIAQQIIQLCAQRSQRPGVAHVVPVEQVLETGAHLNVARYVQVDDPDGGGDLSALRRTRVRLHLEVESLQRRLDGEVDTLLRELGG